MLKRLLLVLLSAAVLTLSGALVLRALASHQLRTLESARTLLNSGAAYLERDLATAGHDLTPAAAEMAVDPTLAADLRTLVNTVNFVQGASRTPPPVVAARLEIFKSKLNEHIAAFRATHPSIDGVALVNELGVVMVSDRSSFAIGRNLAPGRAAPSESDATASASPAPDASASASSAPAPSAKMAP